MTEIEELIEEVTRRFVDHDTEGVADLCLIAVLDHFGRQMDAYRAAGYSSFSAVLRAGSKSRIGASRG